MEETIWKNYRESIIQGDIYLDLHQQDMQVVSERISKLINTIGATTVIDIGCGPGELLGQLNANHISGVTFEGIDISESQIAEAKKRHNKINFCLSDGTTYLKSLKDNSVSLISFVDVLEHLALDDLIEITNVAQKKLQVGGVIFIRVPNGMAPMNPIIYGDITHQRAFTPQSLTQLAQIAGLKIQQIDGQYFEGKSKFNLLRSSILKYLVYPLTANLLRVLYGSRCGKHYSANLYAVLEKG